MHKRENKIYEQHTRLRPQTRHRPYSNVSPYKTGTSQICSNGQSVQQNLNDLNKTTRKDRMSDTNNFDCKSPTDSQCMSFDETQLEDFRKIAANSNHDMPVDEGCSTRMEFTEQTPDQFYGLSVNTDYPDCHIGKFGLSGPVDSNCIDFYNGWHYPSLKKFPESCPQYKPKPYTLPIPGSRSGTSSSENDLSKDKDIEPDIFGAICIKTSVSETPPPSVSRSGEIDQRYIPRQLFQCLGKKGPTSTVYIQHDRATDSMDGDIFGVDIYTDESSKKKNYYRHFFVKVNPHSPADKMKIQYGDELVMVNDRFAPELDHKQIMDLFSRIPVDGVTRFALILRRQDPSKRSPTNKKWEWFETSAILVPELGKDPATKDLQYKKTGNFYDYEMSHRYKVIGEQNFLTLSKEGVGADILYGDKVRDRCKDIWKHAIVCEIGPDGEKLDYKASLSCADKTYYATINCNNVTVVETEVFFEYRKMGSEIYFKKGDSYLNCENRTVGASVNLQFFEEFGSPGHKDVVDGICKSANDVSGSVPGYPFRRITRSMSSQASFTTQFCNMSV